jgi:hypothetical protein
MLGDIWPKFFGILQLFGDFEAHNSPALLPVMPPNGMSHNCPSLIQTPVASQIVSGSRLGPYMAAFTNLRHMPFENEAVIRVEGDDMLGHFGRDWMTGPKTQKMCTALLVARSMNDIAGFDIVSPKQLFKWANDSRTPTQRAFLDNPPPAKKQRTSEPMSVKVNCKSVSVHRQVAMAFGKLTEANKDF